MTENVFVPTGWERKPRFASLVALFADRESGRVHPSQMMGCRYNIIFLQNIWLPPMHKFHYKNNFPEACLKLSDNPLCVFSRWQSWLQWLLFFSRRLHFEAAFSATSSWSEMITQSVSLLWDFSWKRLLEPVIPLPCLENESANCRAPIIPLLKVLCNFLCVFHYSVFSSYGCPKRKRDQHRDRQRRGELVELDKIYNPA